MPKMQAAFPLHEACRIGSVATTRDLLAAGADPNALNDAGCPVLCLACCLGHEDMVAMLLEAGASADSVDENGGTVLQAACSRGHAKSFACS
jgi:ankyrin repeat protein